MGKIIEFEDLMTEINDVEDLFIPKEALMLDEVLRLLRMCRIFEAINKLDNLRTILDDNSLINIIDNWILALKKTKDNGYLNFLDSFKSFDNLVEEGFITLSDDKTTIVDVKRDLMGSLYVPNYITRVEHRAFCETNLSKIILDNGLEELGESAFENSPFLKKVVLSDNIIEIPYRCFYGCSNLTEFAFNDNCEECCRESFSKTGLEKVIFNKNMKYIRDDAFGDCYNLEEVFNTDNLEIIGNRAFFGCENLSYFNISKNVLILGLGAFENCLSCDINLYSTRFEEECDSFKNCRSVNHVFSENSLGIGNFYD